jgi:hypothetical protein
MNEAEENDVDYDRELPDDIHIHRISVPGGWVYLTYVRRKDGGDVYTSDISTVYVPGRR